MWSRRLPQCNKHSFTEKDNCIRFHDLASFRSLFAMTRWPFPCAVPRMSFRETLHSKLVEIHTMTMVTLSLKRWTRSLGDITSIPMCRAACWHGADHYIPCLVLRRCRMPVFLGCCGPCCRGLLFAWKTASSFEGNLLRRSSAGQPRLHKVSIAAFVVAGKLGPRDAGEFTLAKDGMAIAHY